MKVTLQRRGKNRRGSHESTRVSGQERVPARFSPVRSCPWPGPRRKGRRGARPRPASSSGSAAGSAQIDTSTPSAGATARRSPARTTTRSRRRSPASGSASTCRARRDVLDRCCPGPHACTTRSSTSTPPRRTAAHRPAGQRARSSIRRSARSSPTSAAPGGERRAGLRASSAIRTSRRGPGFLGSKYGYVYLTDTDSGPAGLTAAGRRRRRRARRGARRCSTRSAADYQAATPATRRSPTTTAAAAEGFRLAGPAVHEASSTSTTEPADLRAALRRRVRPALPAGPPAGRGGRAVRRGRRTTSTSSTAPAGTRTTRASSSSTC